MRLSPVLMVVFAAGLMSACAAPPDTGPAGAPVVETAPNRPEVSGSVPKVAETVREMSLRDRLWRASDHAATLIDASCPAGTRRQEPLPIDLSVTPVSLGSADQIARRIPENATLSGAWELSSPNSNFGGLSGLARLPASEGGGLLSVSDAGAFIWIDLQNGAPTSAKISYMQGVDGAQLTGKAEGDAEGLVWTDGLALVSFEREFRIEAFALEACGSAARAARVASLPGQYNGRNIDPNQGPEALYLQADGALGFGYEGMLGTSPLGRVLADGTAEWTGETAPAPALHGLVGREIVALPDGSARTIEMFRAWDPLQGNRIRLTWGESETETLTLSRPLLVDNFEGIAAEPLENGAVRVWIVSDNNFSGSQRTLLYAFDLTISQD
ncbi:MAG: esterase-like activity of phytase family protein [Hyphomonas sp.]